MQYALLAYGHQNTRDGARPMESEMAPVLARPYVTGWARLHADESATTVRGGREARCSPTGRSSRRRSISPA